MKSLRQFFFRKLILPIKLRRMSENFYWNLADIFPFSVLSHLAKRTNPTILNTEEDMLVFKGWFNMVIWWDKPCMGSDGPNPERASPYVFKELASDSAQKMSFTIYPSQEQSKWNQKIVNIYFERKNLEFLYKKEGIVTSLEFFFKKDGITKTGKAYFFFPNGNWFCGDIELVFD